MSVLGPFQTDVRADGELAANCSFPALCGVKETGAPNESCSVIGVGDASTGCLGDSAVVPEGLAVTLDEFCVDWHALTNSNNATP